MVTVKEIKKAENSKGEEKMLALWQKNGNYSAEATEEERLAAIEKWKVWLTEKLNDGKEE